MFDRSHGGRGTDLLPQNVTNRKEGAGKKESSFSLPSDLPVMDNTGTQKMHLLRSASFGPRVGQKSIGGMG